MLTAYCAGAIFCVCTHYSCWLRLSLGLRTHSPSIDFLNPFWRYIYSHFVKGEQLFKEHSKTLEPISCLFTKCIMLVFELESIQLLLQLIVHLYYVQYLYYQTAFADGYYIPRHRTIPRAISSSIPIPSRDPVQSGLDRTGPEWTGLDHCCYNVTYRTLRN